jgi:hypothetical protein
VTAFLADFRSTLGFLSRATVKPSSPLSFSSAPCPRFGRRGALVDPSEVSEDLIAEQLNASGPVLYRNDESELDGKGFVDTAFQDCSRRVCN